MHMSSREKTIYNQREDFKNNNPFSCVCRFAIGLLAATQDQHWPQLTPPALDAYVDAMDRLEYAAYIAELEIDNDL
jgi:hypothetical protein